MTPSSGSQSARGLLEAALKHAWELKDRDMAWALGHLGGIADVRFSREVETACIRRRGDRYAILFSPDFAKRYLTAAPDALFVLLHEIFHKIHGDLNRDWIADAGPVGKLVANIVADARINSALCRRFFPEGPEVLDRLYGGGGFPGLLLLSPQGLHRSQGGRGAPPEWDGVATSAGRKALNRLAERALQSGGANEGSAALASWYVDAWTHSGSFQNLFERLRLYFGDEPEVLLLGDHLGDGRKIPWLEGLLEQEVVSSTRTVAINPIR